MTQFRSGVARLSVLALTAAVAAGCDTVGPDGTGNVQVTMQKIASAAATQSLADGFASAADGSYVPIDLDNVISFTVDITSIEFLRVVEVAGEDDWISLDIGLVELNLKDLPTVGAPLVIAAVGVDPVSYRSVRLIVSGGTIVFDQDVSVGQFTFDDAVGGHPVTVPSGVLKTNLAFTVVAGGSTDVNLFFDEDATFRNVTATGSEKVILTPVLRNSSGDGGA